MGFITLEFFRPDAVSGCYYVSYCTSEENGVLKCLPNDGDSTFIKWLRGIYEHSHDISFHHTGRKTSIFVSILKSFCLRRGLKCEYVAKSLIHVDGCDAVREGKWIHRSSWLEGKYGVKISSKKSALSTFMFYWLLETSYPAPPGWFDLFGEGC